MELNHFIVHLKLIQHCQSTILPEPIIKILTLKNKKIKSKNGTPQPSKQTGTSLTLQARNIITVKTVRQNGPPKSYEQQKRGIK